MSDNENIKDAEKELYERLKEANYMLKGNLN